MLVDFFYYLIVPDKSLGSLDCSKRHSAESVNVNILPCQEQILYLGCNRHLRKHQIVAILLESIYRAFLVAKKIAYCKR